MMGRGLSQLQKTILEMAYERWEAYVKDYDAREATGHIKGVRYDVLLGPAIPNPRHVHDFWAGEIRAENARMVRACLASRMDYKEVEEAVDKRQDGYLRKLRERKNKVEEKARTLPLDIEGVDSFGQGPVHFSSWETVYSKPVGFHGNFGREYIDYEALRVAGFINNAPEARRIRDALKDYGVW